MEVFIPGRTGGKNERARNRDEGGGREDGDGGGDGGTGGCAVRVAARSTHCHSSSFLFHRFSLLFSV